MTPLVKLSLRYALILAALQAVIGLLIAFTIDYEHPSPFLTISLAILGFIATMLVVPLAHIEFQKQNGSLSFGQAVGIGYLIIAGSVITGIVMTFVTQAIAPPPPNPYGVVVPPMQQALAGMASNILVQSIVLFFIILFEAQWKVYTKAGKPGWATIIPLYNVIVLLEIVKKPMSWFVLLLIPGVNLIFGIWIVNLLSKRFGKDEGFTVGMILLPFVFYPMLGFSDAVYNPGESEPQRAM
jgi:hypothetical protein